VTTMMKQVYDCATGEEFVIPMTAEEIAEMEITAERQEAERLAAETAAQELAALKTSAKTKLVAGTPLTEEEASVLVI
jgi:hypothetical protein